jgi:hypothetical protein
MLDRILDHRERQQIRKARQRKQAMRYGVIFFAIALVVLAVGAVMEASSPAEEPKTTASKTEQSTTSTQIEAPSEQEFTSKQEKYCLNVNQAVGYKEPELTRQIDACLIETANWSIEKFE